VSVRDSVQRIVAWGRLPDDGHDIGEDMLTKWAAAIDGLEGPLTDDEAIALLSCFPPDDSTVFGVSWSLLHKIETAPYGPTFIEALDDRSWWVALLKERAIRAGIEVTGE
jgi:hypothetical protein